MKEKVVLAYSGGLDTTALIPWLKETFDYDVVCCCVNCGQGNELDGLEERAKMSGIRFRSIHRSSVLFDIPRI